MLVQQLLSYKILPHSLCPSCAVWEDSASTFSWWAICKVQSRQPGFAQGAYSGFCWPATPTLQVHPPLSRTTTCSGCMKCGHCSMSTWELQDEPQVDDVQVSFSTLKWSESMNTDSHSQRQRAMQPPTLVRVIGGRIEAGQNP